MNRTPDELPLVLLIEEDPVLAEVTEFRLELLSFRVETAASAEEALEAVRRRLPDVIVLDLELPDMGGLELTERLSNDQQTSTIPIMVISSNADLDEVQKAYAAGANDYLVIPYDPTTLEEKLGRLLQETARFA